jgi:hypothetical protein
MIESILQCDESFGNSERTRLNSMLLWMITPEGT